MRYAADFFTSFVKQRSGRVLLFRRSKRVRAELEDAMGLPVVIADHRVAVRFTFDGHNYFASMGNHRPMPIYRKSNDKLGAFDSDGLY